MLTKFLLSILALITPLSFTNNVNVAYAESSEPVASEEAPFEEKELSWESRKIKLNLTLKTPKVATLKIDLLDENGAVTDTGNYTGSYVLNQEEQTIVFTFTKENGERWEFDFNILDYDLGVIEYVDNHGVEEPTPEEPTIFEPKTYCWQKGLKVAVLKLETETEYNLSYFTEKAELSTFKGKYEQDGNKLTLYNGGDVLCIVYFNENGNFYFDGEEEIHLKNETFQEIWNSLNAPLPIAGISILIILVWVSVVVFILRKGSSFGRKNINKLNANDKEMKESIEKKEKELDQKYKEKDEFIDKKIKEYDEEIASYKHDVDVIIENSRNKNVLALREDKKDGETKEETER